MAVRVDELKEWLSCPVCFEPFDRHKRVPKILQCMHTFCTRVGFIIAPDFCSVSARVSELDRCFLGSSLYVLFLFDILPGAACLESIHTTHNAAGISCPVCKRVTAVPDGTRSVPQNFGYVDLLEMVSTRASAADAVRENQRVRTGAAYVVLNTNWYCGIFTIASLTRHCPRSCMQ